MIGLHLHNTANSLEISKPQYLTDFETRFIDLLQPMRPTTLPAAGGLRLCVTGITKAPPSSPADVKLYRKLVGSLMYAVVSRPDVAAPLGPPPEAALAFAPSRAPMPMPLGPSRSARG